MPLREIAGPAGRLEALLDEPERGAGARAAVVFAHPHPQQGGTMHTKVVYQAAKAFSRIGCAVLRFNFRGAGTSAGSFSDGPGEMDDLRAALDFMCGRYPSAPLWAGGMSFGSWIALSVGAADPRVTTLIGLTSGTGERARQLPRADPRRPRRTAGRPRHHLRRVVRWHRGRQVRGGGA